MHIEFSHWGDSNSFTYYFANKVRKEMNLIIDGKIHSVLWRQSINNPKIDIGLFYNNCVRNVHRIVGNDAMKESINLERYE